jgi:Ca-activated chloride channel family protein
MKRFLKKDKYQLDGREQQAVWRGIQAARGSGTAGRRPWWRSGLPVFGMTTAVAAVLMVAVWLHDPGAPQRIGNKVQMRVPDAEMKLLPEKPSGTESADDFLTDEIQGMMQGAEQDPADRDLRAAVDRLEKTKELSFQTVPREAPADKPLPQGNQKNAGQGERTKSGGQNLGTPPPPPKPVARAESRVNEHSGSIQPVPDTEASEGVALAELMPMTPPQKGEAKVRGGREADVLMSIDGVAMGSLSEAAPSRLPREVIAQRYGSVTGGTTPPNGEQYELMYFEHAGVNPFIATEEDALSTFAVDVDNASYTVVRNYLNRDALPPRDAVRVEEFVNFFGGDYPAQSGDVFAVHTDGSASRFGAGYHMLRVGLQGMNIDETGRKPATLIFIIDVSGSMNRENRLGTVKKSLRILVDQLGEGDRVGIVTYGSQGRVLLEPADLNRRDEILRAIERLAPGGSTNAVEGLDLAYDLARDHLDRDGINRLILCSDGVANMGATRAEEILAKVKHSSSQGISLSTVGFGMGNYNDVLMEKLANQGDGNYHYVDSLDEARRVFKENLTGLLQTIARQVKIQVEFDPEQVQRWRLLGYENRDVADRDFRNDKVDAGEVGAGHQVTALYELKLKDADPFSDLEVEDEAAELGTVRVRYQYPAHDRERAEKVEEIEHAIPANAVTDKFDKAPPAYRLQAVAAEFAEILRGSYWARESSLSDLRDEAESVADALDRGTEQRDKAEELIRLIRKAGQLREELESRELPAGGEEE